MKIESLKPGMVVYDAHSHRMGNTTMRTMGVWPVHVVSVEPEAGVVVARWNGNPQQRYYRGSWSKWRLKEPILTKVGLTQRIATRAEIAAMKANGELKP